MEKKLLLNLAKEPDTKAIKKAYADFIDILSSALDDLNQRLKYLSPEKTKIFPIGESTTNTFIDEIGTEIDVMLAINDPQLELANNALKDANKQIKRKNSRKNKELIAIKTNNTSQEITMELFKELINYFSPTTRLIVTKDGIKIFALQELGFNFLIRLSTFDKNDEEFIFKIWNPIAYTTQEINLFEYTEKLEEKNLITKDNLFKIIRIFKSLRKSLILNRQMSPNLLNKYAIELLCYNIPNELLEGSDIFVILAKSINYLNNVPYNALTNFDGKSSIDTFIFSIINPVRVISFIDKIKKLAFN